MHAVAVLIAAAVVVALLAFAYERGDLNKWLPASDQKVQSFRGAYGRNTAMQSCLYYDPSDPYPTAGFNLCTHV